MFVCFLLLEVCSNIDDLFELPAPAAMGRGPWSGYVHGERMNGALPIFDKRIGVDVDAISPSHSMLIPGR